MEGSCQAASSNVAWILAAIDSGFLPTATNQYQQPNTTLDTTVNTSLYQLTTGISTRNLNSSFEDNMTIYNHITVF